MTTWHDFDEVLSTLVLEDAPAGGALVIYHQGNQVVNTATGLALPNTPWQSDTLSVNFSIGKGVMATLIAVLVSRGMLDYDEPIAKVWADFAHHGKQHITLRQVLTHTAGLFNIASLTKELSDLLDWQVMTDKVAYMTTDTPKGQQTAQYASAYSALVSGWILGKVVELCTSMSLQHALDEYLSKPLGVVGELFYGVPSDKVAQVARPVRHFDGISAHRKPTLKPDSTAVLTALHSLPISQHWAMALGSEGLTTASINRLYFDSSAMNLVNYKNALMPNGRDGITYHHPEVLQAVIPAANGVSTANALAKLYAMHAGGGVWQGQTLITPNVLTDLRQLQVDGVDAVMPANMQWRSGFHRLFSIWHTPNAYGHMGYNGSVAFCDPDRELAVAFVHNFDTTMLNDVRQFALSEMAIDRASQ